MTDNVHPIKPEVSEEIRTLVTQINLKQGDGGTFWADSREVAKKFDKRHADVLRAIENLKAQAPQAERNFAFSEYRDATGRQLPYCLMNKNGFSLLVMGFTGGEAIKWKLAYIEAFNMMEAELRGENQTPATPLDALEQMIGVANTALAGWRKAEAEKARAEALASTYKGQRDLAQQESSLYLSELQGYDRYMDAEGLTNISDVARLMGVGQKWFFAFLQEQPPEFGPSISWMFETKADYRGRKGYKPYAHVRDKFLHYRREIVDGAFHKDGEQVMRDTVKFNNRGIQEISKILNRLKIGKKASNQE